MQKRYDFSAIIERPQFSWPEGKRLAVYLAVNVESYSLGSGVIEELAPASPQPDVLNYSWCDYGNRVGIWRILRLLNELSLPATLLVNSNLYSEAPQIVAAFRDRGDEIACHGRTNSERQNGLSEAEERQLIHEATSALREHEKVVPRGWLGPWISENERTPELLKAAGYRYLLDWACDDQPVWMRTAAGPILSVPYPQELNDSSTMIGRFVGPSEFAQMIMDQFDEMLEQAAEQPLVLGIALHSHISGQPFRLRALRRALECIADRTRGHWLTHAGSIADHFSSVIPAAQ